MLSLTEKLLETLNNKRLIMDGAMGSEIFSSLNCNYKTFNYKYCEHLNIHNPELIKSIHKSYLEAGATLIKCNTFSGASLFLDEYILENSLGGTEKQEAYRANFEGVKIAKEVAQKFSLNKSEKIIIAGIISLPWGQEIHKEALEYAFHSQINSLLDGGADLLFLESLYDLEKTLLLIDVIDKNFSSIPIMLSFSPQLKNVDGLEQYSIFSGESLKDACDKIITKYPSLNYISFGLNCCSCSTSLIKPILELENYLIHRGLKNIYISLHPSAGIPSISTIATYPDTVKKFISNFSKIIERSSKLRFIGGCCGTNPDYIAQLISFNSIH